MYAYVINKIRLRYFDFFSASPANNLPLERMTSIRSQEETFAFLPNDVYVCVSFVIILLTAESFFYLHYNKRSAEDNLRGKNANVFRRQRMLDIRCKPKLFAGLAVN